MPGRGAVLVGAEALLLVRFHTESAAEGQAPRTILTTASSLSDSLRSVLPARVIGISAAGKSSIGNAPALFQVREIWLPALLERNQAVLFRFDSEHRLRDGRLEYVPDVEGRTLYLTLAERPLD